MRFLSLFLITTLFFNFTELQAKKRSSWGGSKKASFSSKQKISKSSTKTTSFDKKRAEKIKQAKSQEAYKKYKDQKENSAVAEKGNSGAIATGTGIGSTTAIAVANSVNSANSNSNYSNHFNSYSSNHTVSQGFNGWIIILLFILIFGGILFFSLKKKGEVRKKILTPKEFPLDLRVGGIVDVESIRPRLLINKNNFQMKVPKILKGYVKSVGFIELDEELQIFNVSVSENIDENEPAFNLRIEVLNKDISSVKLYTLYEKIYPQTVSEWEEWLDGDEEHYPNIGGLDFSIPSGVSYNRVWNAGSDEVVRSKFVEKVIEAGDKSKDTMNISSLYSRPIENDEAEFLYVSNVEDSELNNFIKIEIGITIRETELEII
jgi:hypothetical protein